MRKEWSTPIPAGIALIGAGLALSVASVASYQEPPGMVLLGIAALLLFAVGAVALLRRPRLTLNDGPVLVIRTLRGSIVVGPEDIASLEMLSTRRLASRSVQLLIETHDDQLAVFGRWDLGVAPQAVADELAAAGFDVNDRR